MRHLAGLFRSLLGDEILLFTTDGPQGLRCGSLPGLYTTIDFGPGLLNKGWEWSLGTSSVICVLYPCFLLAADNMTKLFALLRSYEPHGPLVRGYQEGESKKKKS